MAFKRIGYGQVEPNQLSGIKTGQIFASLPLDKEVKVLQNGEFMYYDYANGSVNATAEANAAPEPYLVYQEIKIYEDWLSYKDFAMIRVGDNYVTNKAAIGRVTSAPIDPITGTAAEVYGDGSLTVGVNANPGHTEYGYRMDGIAPRLFKTNIGDIFTTNMVETGVEYSVGNILKLKKNDDSKTLVLSKSGDINTIEFVVAKVYTMPDGQPGLKIQRIK